MTTNTKYTIKRGDLAPALTAERNGHVEQAVLRIGKFISRAEMRKWAVEPVDWIVDQLIPTGQVSAIIAESGAGKTWSGLYMAKCIAEGKPFHTHTCKRRKVAYCDIEGSFKQMHRRFTALEVAHGIPKGDQHEVDILSDVTMLDIEDVELFVQFVARVRETECDVLFIDTLSKIHKRDENENAMRLVMVQLERLARECGCTVIFLHHTGHAEKGRARGSTTIHAGCQHVIVLTVVKTEGDTGRAKLELTKAKEGPKIPFIAEMSVLKVAGDGIRIQFDDEQTKMGRPGKGDERTDALLHILRESKGMAHNTLVTTLASKCECSESSAKRTIADALAEGEIQKVGDMYAQGSKGSKA